MTTQQINLPAPSPVSKLLVAMVGVLVVPVSCVSHGGLEHTLCAPPVRLDVAVDGVLVVPVSCVSQGGFEHTC